MPRRDGTGPRGMGPMTGRGAGFCVGYANTLPGRGLGMGFGRGAGRGWRNMFFATGQPGWMRFGANAAPVGDPDPEMEKQALKNQADYLQNELDSIRLRMEELDKEPGQK
jgi:hypothetical protein